MKPSPDKSQPRDSFKGSNPNTKHEDQETRVRTRHETMDWFKIGKGACQGCILSPCLLNLHAEYIMWNARLDELQAGIKITGRENKLRHGNDITLIAENEEELNSLLIRVKEENEKAGLKFNIKEKKTKITASDVITS